jgi:hypothetical protein
MTIRLMVRGYLGRVIQFEKPCEVDSEAMAALLPGLAEEHANAMAEGRLGRIEIEFLDEPDVNERFFRIGVDPSGMVMPVGVNSEGRKQ